MRKNGKIVHCTTCGKEKYVSGWQFKLSKTGRFFCGTECCNEFQRGENSYSWQGGGHSVNCAVCGAEKKVDSWALRKQKIFFCGKECISKFYSENPTGAAGLKGEKNNKWKGGQVEVRCAWCKKPKMVDPYQINDRENHFCNPKCKGKWDSENTIGYFSSFWKGGVIERNVGLYSHYKDKLLFDKTREHPEEEDVLQVKCIYCGKFFTPTRSQISNRISYLNGKLQQESNFYCSIACKKSCPIYGRQKFPKGFKTATSREVQPDLRKMRFELDNWKCQICESEDDLHCHHLEGIEQNPIESADVDMCITLCKTHHKWVHTKEGCRYFDLRCKT